MTGLRLVTMEVQNHRAAYKGLITPKNKKIKIFKGAALELPPGHMRPGPFDPGLQFL